MATIDNFDDTEGTLLQSHTPSGGGSWTKHSAATCDAEIASNRVRNGGSGQKAVYYHSADPASAEYDVEGDLYRADSSDGDRDAGVAGRMDTTDETFYNAFASIYPGFNGYYLDKAVSGTYTRLGSYETSISASSTTAVKLELRDAAKKVYVAGTERISSSDNAITATGKAGLRIYHAGLASDTTGVHMDNLDRTDVSSGTNGTMAAAACTATAGSPNATVAAGAALAAAAAQATAGSPNAALSGGALLAGALVQAAATAPNASATTGAVLSAAVSQSTAAAPNASLTVAASLAAEVAQATAGAPDATAAGGALFDAAVTQASAASPSASLTTGQAGSLAAAVCQATAAAPNAAAIGGARLGAGLVAIVASSPDATVTGGALLPGAICQATAGGPNATIGISAALQAALAAATAGTPNATVSAGAVFLASLCTVVAAVPNATMTVPGSEQPGRVGATAIALMRSFGSAVLPMRARAGASHAAKGSGRVEVP